MLGILALVALAVHALVAGTVLGSVVASVSKCSRFGMYWVLAAGFALSGLLVFLVPLPSRTVGEAAGYEFLLASAFSRVNAFMFLGALISGFFTAAKSESIRAVSALAWAFLVAYVARALALVSTWH